MKKNIVFILTNYIGGGQEQCFNKTARALLENNTDLSIYIYIIDHFTMREQIPKDVMVIENLKELITLKIHRKNCVFVNYSSDWKSSLTTALISKRYISWIHGNPLIMATARTQKINFFCLRKSYRNVCVCHEQGNLLHELYGFNKSNLLTIYNCVDLEYINIKKEEPINIECKYILMVARFDFSSKDYPTLLNAYARLNKDLRNEYKLVLLGNGPDEYTMKLMIKNLELEEYVIMPGYDPNPFKWISNASLFMLISKTEGFPLSVIEAMACKTPVLITNYHTGSLEVSQNNKNCLTVNVGDINGLSNTISKILNNLELASKLTKNALSFVSVFDYKYFSKQINDFFIDLEDEL